MILLLACTTDLGDPLGFALVDTEQTTCFDATSPIDCGGDAWFGQDADYTGAAPSYEDHGDGTVTDLVTGLMWQQDPGDKMSYDDAMASTPDAGGYDDWRVPTLKELYSLMRYDGTDVSGMEDLAETDGVPFIDDAFAFEYGDESAGERVIDSQYLSTDLAPDPLLGGDSVFGVNFADGRIKGYELELHGEPKEFFVQYVRGGTYGDNDLEDVGDGVVLDHATGLEWMQQDLGPMTWQDALATCEDAGWRLPNAKELQSIVDNTRSPDSTGEAAIDPLFDTTEITNEAGEPDFPFFWTSTTLQNLTSDNAGSTAIYICFGRCLGYQDGDWIDVHGVGAQRSDPKTGDASDYPTGHGPQGDAVRIENFARCVR